MTENNLKNIHDTFSHLLDHKDSKIYYNNRVNYKAFYEWYKNILVKEYKFINLLLVSGDSKVWTPITWYYNKDDLDEESEMYIETGFFVKILTDSDDCFNDGANNLWRDFAFSCRNKDELHPMLQR